MSITSPGHMTKMFTEVNVERKNERKRCNQDSNLDLLITSQMLPPLSYQNPGIGAEDKKYYIHRSSSIFRLDLFVGLVSV